MDTIAHAAAHLRAGGLVAMPTETVYGLAAIARDADAVARVFKAKGRPSNNPMIVHAATLAMAQGCCEAWPPAAEALARAFWPGPVTLVLPRAAWVPEIVTAGGPTVAVRVPRHPVAMALIEAVGEPLVAPSANRSGYVSPTAVEHVSGVWPRGEVVVLDGGPCQVGLESTVVAVGEDSVRVLRPGVIGPADIARAAGVPVLEREGADATSASPGLVGPHYQPRARLVLVDDPEDVRAYLNEPMVVFLGPPGVAIDAPRPHEALAMPQGPAEYARNLYGMLRAADTMEPSIIVVCVPGGAGSVWDAVRERLSRAASR